MHRVRASRQPGKMTRTLVHAVRRTVAAVPSIGPLLRLLRAARGLFRALGSLGQTVLLFFHRLGQIVLGAIGSDRNRLPFSRQQQRHGVIASCTVVPVGRSHGGGACGGHKGKRPLQLVERLRRALGKRIPRIEDLLTRRYQLRSQLSSRRNAQPNHTQAVGGNTQQRHGQNSTIYHPHGDHELGHLVLGSKSRRIGHLLHLGRQRIDTVHLRRREQQRQRYQKRHGHTRRRKPLLVPNKPFNSHHAMHLPYRSDDFPQGIPVPMTPASEPRPPPR